MRDDFVTMPGLHRPHDPGVRAVGLGLLGLCLLLPLPGCKKPSDVSSCNPDEKGFSTVRVVVQPAAEINLDPEGTSRATSLHIFQLKGGRSLDIPLDFQQVWQDAPSAFGDELLDDQELTIYPDKPDVFEIEANPDATHWVAVAIYREPVGNAWYAEWEVPRYHGHSVCAAEREQRSYEDPCFLVFMEGSQIDGGHKPPPGMNAQAIPVVCPPPPLKVEPKPPEAGKKKKKRKKGKDVQEDAAEAQDKAGEAQEAADQAQEVGDTVSDPKVPAVPGQG